MNEGDLVDSIGAVLNQLTGGGDVNRQTPAAGGTSLATTVGTALGASSGLMTGISAGARLLGSQIGGSFGSIVSAIFG